MTDRNMAQVPEKSVTAQNSTRLRRQRQLIAVAVIALTSIFLLAINLGSYFFVKRMETYLAGSLDDRLKSTALLTSELIERNTNNFYDPGEQTLLRIRLNRWRTLHELEAIYLIDQNMSVILDARWDLEAVHRSYLSSDSAAIRKASSGQIATSKLHTIADNHFKNAYALILDFSGNPAVLVLEANATFLNAIDFFRRGLVIGALISLALLVFIVFFLFGASRLLLRTEMRLHESQRLAIMGQMAATMAHEIRNPLGIIKSTGDLLREKIMPTEENAVLFRYLDEEVMRLNRLVSEFLSFAKEPVLNRKAIDMVRLITEAVQTFNRRDERKTELLFESMLPECVMKCDPDKIEQVLLNLFYNAEQAIDPWSGKIIVSLQAEKLRGKAFLRIDVSDNGPGLTVSEEQLFMPFFTTKTRGTGLGLTVSRSIIEKHGGRMKAVNKTDGGTTFSFWLPLKND